MWVQNTFVQEGSIIIDFCHISKFELLSEENGEKDKIEIKNDVLKVTFLLILSLVIIKHFNTVHAMPNIFLKGENEKFSAILKGETYKC